MDATVPESENHWYSYTYTYTYSYSYGNGYSDKPRRRRKTFSIIQSSRVSLVSRWWVCSIQLYTNVAS